MQCDVRWSQNKTKQNKTKQSKAKQSKAKQNKTKQTELGVSTGTDKLTMETYLRNLTYLERGENTLFTRQKVWN